MINCYLPSNIDLTNAVLSVIGRCCIAGSSFTSISVTETVRLEHRMWIIYHDTVIKIIEDSFDTGNIKGNVIDYSSKSCGCFEDCYCESGIYKKVPYKKRLVNDNGLEYCKYYV